MGPVTDTALAVCSAEAPQDMQSDSEGLLEAA